MFSAKSHAIAAILTLYGLTAAADETVPLPVSVFDMTFINYSQEVDYGVRNEAEHARIRMLSDYLRELLDESERYEVVDLTGLQDELKQQGSVFKCNHCEGKLARKVGARRSFTGAVNKLSTLVQTVILRERDPETGEVIALYQTDIRGNTDEAWRRGLSFLVENRLFKGPP